MDRIYEIMNKFSSHNFGTRYDGRYGIEIETETIDPYDIPKFKFWKCDRDNSLRNFGIEYILKAPITYEEVPIALGEWEKFSKKVKFIPDSHSTSVHVHINFLNESFLTMANFFTTWALIENVMIRFSGPNRLSNLFCLPIIDAEGVMDTLVSMMRSVETKQYKRISVHQDSVKYGAINPGPFTSLGSIEIRCFRGEMDTSIQYQWVTMLEKILEYCRTQGLTPHDICDTFKSRGVRILEEIFGNELARVLKANIAPSDLVSMMNSNIKYSAKIAIQSKNWSKFGIVVVKKVYKEHLKADLDALSRKYIDGATYDSLSYAMQLVVQEDYYRVNPTTRIVEAEEDV